MNAAIIRFIPTEEGLIYLVQVDGVAYGVIFFLEEAFGWTTPFMGCETDIHGLAKRWGVSVNNVALHLACEFVRFAEKNGLLPEGLKAS